ncbi:phosphohexomutase domain-containing protein [Roseitranquillus sediminis]|uniref:phosphomannomutase n=1 Tax=Roseitranquillus sediminis TaxID=2809051 RepID=UPI001D0CA1D3|nr:phosphomannomutase [Roseitranquillus sediminis]MBM9593908.1 phosphomannomutase [Roseitranquillus sediminis]
MQRLTESEPLRCFKAYDVRGRIGVELDEAVARRIGRAAARVLSPRLVVVGHDARASSPGLAAALAEGLREGGAGVCDIGLCGTEEVYFATGRLPADAGIMVTASHNPIDYNGMKLVGPGSRPLSEAEFAAIRDAAADPGTAPAAGQGGLETRDLRPAYAAHVADQVRAEALGPMRIVTDAGNGTAGLALDAIAAELARRGARLDLVRVRHEPDAGFPHGIPNPLVPENRALTAAAVREAGADLGVAWDGDFDRCFLFDATGAFVPGEYVVALLARAVLAREPGAAIVHDPRVIWAIEETVAREGGRAVAARTGHAFVKAAMRESGAAYGGEMSAHHYFRDFYFCDSGMIPWLRIVELLSASGQSLAEAVAELRARHPSSGEINFEVPDPAAAIARVEARLAPDAEAVDRRDGLGLGFGAWRLNLRASNTEPLLRLNLETRGDAELLRRKTAELTALIGAGAG